MATVCTFVIALLAGSAQAADTAGYRVEVAIAWSAETHPHEFPSDAHFSGLVGATHNARYTLFADGRTASGGLELVAENGRASILRAEFAEALRRKRIGSVFDNAGLKMVPGVMTATFEVDADYRYVSFVAMIAPSPDWFTGLSGAELMRNEKWVDRLKVTLWAWDSGTDGGQTYAAPNADTQPRESVRLLATPHVFSGAGLKPIGTATFIRLE